MQPRQRPRKTFPGPSPEPARSSYQHADSVIESQKGLVAAVKLLIDTSKTTFMVTRTVAEKTDLEGKQRFDRVTREPLWTVQVMALDESGAEVLMLTVPGLPPKVAVGQAVFPVALEAIPWAQNGKNGVAYRVRSLEDQPTGQQGQKAA